MLDSNEVALVEDTVVNFTCLSRSHLHTYTTVAGYSSTRDNYLFILVINKSRHTSNKRRSGSDVCLE